MLHMKLLQCFHVPARHRHNLQASNNRAQSRFATQSGTQQLPPRRPIVPEDLPELRAAHQALFPIDYESHFYECVVYSRDHIFSWAAVCRLAVMLT